MERVMRPAVNRVRGFSYEMSADLRRGVRIGTLVVLLSPAPLCTLSAQKPDQVDQRALVQVLSREPWTDTGVLIKPGDRVRIRAWGTVVIDRARTARTVGPSGVGAHASGCEFLVITPGVGAESLVANVAEDMTLDGSGFQVGASLTATAPFAGAARPGGHLFLGINHHVVSCDRSGYDSWALRNDTSGALTAEIIVSRAP
jgi:hypothetical protein